MQVSIFCTLGLNKPIHAPKIGVSEGFDPLNGEWQQRNPIPCAEARHMTYRSYRSSKSVKRLQRYGDLTVFKTAVVRHLGFVGRGYLDHSR